MAKAKKKVPASPSGQIGKKRPPNKRPRRKEPHEIAKDEPDARFGDERQPNSDAREGPDGEVPPLERRPGYKNTDEDL